MSPASRMDVWRDRFWQDNPLFSHLEPWCEKLPEGRWPTAEDWNMLFAAANIRNHLGIPVTIVPQASHGADWREGYEPRTYLKGEVQTRDANWHDLFNALTWLALPRSKAAINMRHYGEFAARAHARRTPSPCSTRAACWWPARTLPWRNC